MLRRITLTLPVFCLLQGATMLAWPTSEPSKVLFGDNLASIPAFVDADKAARYQRLTSECNGVHPRCVSQLVANSLKISAVAPDNPHYLAAFDLRNAHFSDDPQQSMQLESANKLVRGIQDWINLQIAQPEGPNLREVVDQLSAIRRLLGECNSLIELMPLVAITGMTTELLNYSRGSANESHGEVEQSELRDLLAPLNAHEKSFERFMDHDYALWVKEYGDPSDDDLQRFHIFWDAIISQSEKPSAKFWAEGIDVHAMAALEDWNLGRAYEDYIVNLLRAELSMQRTAALLEMYSGRVTPGVPAVEPPGSWSWEWREQELCLVGKNVHTRFGGEALSGSCSRYWGN